MRVALVLAFVACSSKNESAQTQTQTQTQTTPATTTTTATPTPKACETVRVQLDGAKAFYIPTRAEYCLWTPEPAACCAKEGTSCEAFSGSAAPVFDVVRAPGCPEPQR